MFCWKAFCGSVAPRRLILTKVVLMTSSLETALPPPPEVLGTTNWRSRGFPPTADFYPSAGDRTGHFSSPVFAELVLAWELGTEWTCPTVTPCGSALIGTCPPCLAWLTPPCPLVFRSRVASSRKPVLCASLSLPLSHCSQIFALALVTSTLLGNGPVHCAAWNGLDSPQTQIPPASLSLPALRFPTSSPPVLIRQDGDENSTRWLWRSVTAVVSVFLCDLA